jgi:hypothetical protein
MKWPVVTATLGSTRVANDCISCAERRIITRLLRDHSKTGLDLDKFPSWLNRKYGTMYIERVRHDGHFGRSIPCVMCRKVIEKYRIKWCAFDGHTWLHSSRDTVPDSAPTNKQRFLMGFS